MLEPTRLIIFVTHTVCMIDSEYLRTIQNILMTCCQVSHRCLLGYLFVCSPPDQVLLFLELPVRLGALCISLQFVYMCKVEMLASFNLRPGICKIHIRSAFSRVDIFPVVAFFIPVPVSMNDYLLVGQLHVSC